MSTKGKAESFVEMRGSLKIPDMITGKSAYEIAVLHGFQGTEEEWIKHVTAEADRSEAEANRAETEADRANDIAEKIAAGTYSEKDPTVPNWAKQPAKPTYTAAEIGAAPASIKTINAPQMNYIDLLATAEDLSVCPLNAVTYFRTYNASNAPKANTSFFVTVRRMNIVSIINVEVVEGSTGKKWENYFTSNGWSGWIQTTTDADKRFHEQRNGVDLIATVEDDKICPLHATTFLRIVYSTNLPPSGNDFYVTAKKPNVTGWIILEATNTHTGTKWERQKLNGAWSDWECVNPPMELGVEYRTTERFMGKPVYTKLISLGEGPNNAEKEVEHGITNGFVIDYGAYALNPNSSFFGHLPWLDYLKVLFIDGERICVSAPNHDYSRYTLYAWFKYYKSTD